MDTEKPNRLLSLDEVTKKTTLSRSSIYAMRKRGEFPEPLRVSLSGVAWRESDLDEWIANLPTRSSTPK